MFLYPRCARNLLLVTTVREGFDASVRVSSVSATSLWRDTLSLVRICFFTFVEPTFALVTTVREGFDASVHESSVAAA